jgi:uncharacterized protein YyaL (SSP411 family)
MLYDNALLARLYLAAAVVLKRQDFEALGRETLDFLLARMRTPDGAFVASFSAVDGQGVEGGYYLWRADELRRLLTEDERRVAGVWYGMEGNAPFDAGFLPRRTMTAGAAARRLGMPPAQVEALWRSVRAKLLKAREARVLPADDKPLAGWNGLALSALARGAGLANGTRYREAADKLARYLATRSWDGRRLRRALKGGVAQGRPSLEDYAYVAQGLVEHAGVTGHPSDLDFSGRLIEEAWRRYFAGTWRLAEDELLAGRARRLAVDDGPLPSPAAALLSTSIAYARMKGAAGYPTVIEQALRAAQPAVAENPFWHASYVSAAVAFMTGPLR